MKREMAITHYLDNEFLKRRDLPKLRPEDLTLSMKSEKELLVITFSEQLSNLVLSPEEARQLSESLQQAASFVDGRLIDWENDADDYEVDG